MIKFLKNRFDLISIGFLALLGPLFVFPKENCNWALLAGVGVIIFGRWVLERKFLSHTPIDAAIALLIIWALLGILAVNGLAMGATKLVGLVFGIVSFYIITGALGSISRINATIAIFIFMGLAVSLIGTLSRSDSQSIPQIDNNKIVTSIPKIIIEFERAETGINPNALGGTLLLFIPPGLMVFAHTLKKKNVNARYTARYLALAGLAIVLNLEIFAIAYSRSYGALAALGFILLMIGKKRRFVKVCLGFAILGALFFIMKSPGLNKNAFIKNTRGSLSKSVSARLPLWEGGLEATRTHPIFGLGMDRLRTTKPFNYKDAHAHNQFIHLAAEMGIPVLLAYLAILIGAGWMTVEVIRSKMPEGVILIMRGLAWGQIGFAIFGIADAIPLGSKPGLIFWISLAMMTSIYLFGKENRFLRNNCKPIKAIG